MHNAAQTQKQIYISGIWKCKKKNLTPNFYNMSECLVIDKNFIPVGLHCVNTLVLLSGGRSCCSLADIKYYLLHWFQWMTPNTKKRRNTQLHNPPTQTSLYTCSFHHTFQAHGVRSNPYFHQHPPHSQSHYCGERVVQTFLDGTQLLPLAVAMEFHDLAQGPWKYIQNPKRSEHFVFQAGLWLIYAHPFI